MHTTTIDRERIRRKIRKNVHLKQKNMTRGEIQETLITLERQRLKAIATDQPDRHLKSINAKMVFLRRELEGMPPEKPYINSESLYSDSERSEAEKKILSLTLSDFEDKNVYFYRIFQMFFNLVKKDSPVSFAGIKATLHKNGVIRINDEDECVWECKWDENFQNFIESINLVSIKKLDYSGMNKHTGNFDETFLKREPIDIIFHAFNRFNDVILKTNT